MAALFLDDDLPVKAFQPKLLRNQERGVSAGVEARSPVNVRVITATNRDLCGKS